MKHEISPKEYTRRKRRDWIVWWSLTLIGFLLILRIGGCLAQLRTEKVVGDPYDSPKAYLSAVVIFPKIFVQTKEGEDVYPLYGFDSVTVHWQDANTNRYFISVTLSEPTNNPYPPKYKTVGENELSIVNGWVDKKAIYVR